jgi:tripartite-type tricarboxylate transporter receptor subunit TctC
MRKALVILCLLSIWGLHGVAFAQGDIKTKLNAIKPKDYPTRPIEFIAAAAPGGGLDITARILAKHAEKYLDGRIAIINKPGAGSFIGDTYVATAKPDGYTVGVSSSILLENEILKAKGKWSLKDLEPIAYITNDPCIWGVTMAGPFKDMSFSDVIKMAKQKPESIKVAISPEVFGQWLAEDIEHAAQVKFIKVPFQGGTPAISALLGGHIDISGWYWVEFKPLVESGKAKIIAQAGSERSLFPSVPTFNEVLGVDHIQWASLRFTIVPKGLPRERFRYLEAVIDAALRDPECVRDYANVGSRVGIKYLNSKQTLEEIEKRHRTYTEFFRKIGRISN